MLGARFGHFLDKPLAPLVKKLNVNPNILTVLGFLITAAAAAVIPFNLFLGGIVMGIGALCDLLDGMVARVHHRTTRFGAFLDSLLDRYSDALIFLSLAWHLADTGNHTGAFLSIGTMVGALLVSYARARGEGLGINTTAGLMERPERMILLIAAALTGWVVPVLWVLCVLTHVTVVQRVCVVWRAMKNASGKTTNP